jgi:Family of unknown function (DUF6886)
MDTDYPESMLAREPAPPYEGEGPFALWHFSDDPSLVRLRPHVPATNPQARPLVWAVDTRHAPLFWFPRDCPRGCIWPVSATTAEDHERFFGQSAATRIHVIEADWPGRAQVCRLYAYRLPAEAFRPHEVGGYWVAEEPVEVIEQVIVDDLLGWHARARIEFRVTPSIWPFWRRVTGSTVEFSGSRLRNAGAHPDRSGVLGRHWLAQRLVGHRAGPAHPGGRGLGMVAELLRDPLGAADPTERADGSGDGLPDLSGTWHIGTLQCRDEQGVSIRAGIGGTDAGVLRCWPHRELLGPAVSLEAGGCRLHITILPRKRRRSNGAGSPSEVQDSPCGEGG